MTITVPINNAKAANCVLQGGPKNPDDFEAL